MERLQAAIQTVYREWEKQAVPERPFFTYCRLSDLCGGDFGTRRELKLFFDANRILPLFTIFSNYGKERGRKILLTGYPEVSRFLSKEQFEGMLENLSETLFSETDFQPEQLFVNANVSARCHSQKERPTSATAFRIATTDSSSDEQEKQSATQKEAKKPNDPEPEQTERNESETVGSRQEKPETEDEKSWNVSALFPKNPVRIFLGLFHRLKRKIL